MENYSCPVKAGLMRSRTIKEQKFVSSDHMIGQELRISDKKKSDDINLMTVTEMRTVVDLNSKI